MGHVTDLELHIAWCMHACFQSQNEGNPPGLDKLETSQEVQKLLQT